MNPFHHSDMNSAIESIELEATLNLDDNNDDAMDETGGDPRCGTIHGRDVRPPVRSESHNKETSTTTTKQQENTEKGEESNNNHNNNNDDNIPAPKTDAPVDRGDPHAMVDARAEKKKSFSSFNTTATTRASSSSSMDERKESVAAKDDSSHTPAVSPLAEFSLDSGYEGYHHGMEGYSEISYMDSFPHDGNGNPPCEENNTNGKTHIPFTYNRMNPPCEEKSNGDGGMTGIQSLNVHEPVNGQGSRVGQCTSQERRHVPTGMTSSSLKEELEEIIALHAPRKQRGGSWKPLETAEHETKRVKKPNIASASAKGKVEQKEEDEFEVASTRPTRAEDADAEDAEDAVMVELAPGGQGATMPQGKEKMLQWHRVEIPQLAPTITTSTGTDERNNNNDSTDGPMNVVKSLDNGARGERDEEERCNQEEKEKGIYQSNPELTETPEITEHTSGGDQQQVATNDNDGSLCGAVGKNTLMHGKLTRNYSDASQTMKHHLHVCLKFVGLMYQHYEERMKVGNIKDCDKDERYLQVVMLNSSLLKALHVCESFQAHCVREFPEISFDFDDPLTSFDGTLTTIYEGEDMCSVTDRIPVPVEQPVPAEVHRSLQTECVCLRDSKNAIEAQKQELEEKVLELDKIVELGLDREKKMKERINTLEKEQEKCSEQVEIVPGYVLDLKRGEDSVSVSNADLERFVKLIQHLSSEEKQAKEARDAARFESDKLMHEADEAMRLMSDITAGRVNASRTAIQTPLTLIEKVRKLVNDRMRYAAEIKKLRAETKNSTSNDVWRMQVKDLEIRLQTMYAKYREAVSRKAAIQSQVQARSMKRRSSVAKSDENNFGTPVQREQRSRSSTSNIRAQSTSTLTTSTPTRITGSNFGLRTRGCSERPAERVTTPCADLVSSARTGTDDSEGRGCLEEQSGVSGMELNGAFHVSMSTPIQLAPSPSAPHLQQQLLKKHLQVTARLRSSSAGRRDEAGLWDKCMRRVSSKTGMPSIFDPPKRDVSGVSGSLPPTMSNEGSKLWADLTGASGVPSDASMAPPSIISALTGQLHAVPTHVARPQHQHGGAQHPSLITKTHTQNFRNLNVQNSPSMASARQHVTQPFSVSIPASSSQQNPVNFVRHLGTVPSNPTPMSMPTRQLSPTRITKSMVSPWQSTRSSFGPG